MSLQDVCIKLIKRITFAKETLEVSEALNSILNIGHAELQLVRINDITETKSGNSLTMGVVVEYAQEQQKKMLCSGSVLINGCSLHCNEYLPISIFKIVTGLVKQNTHSFVKYHQQPQNIIEDLKSELPLFNQEKIIDFFKPTM